MLNEWNQPACDSACETQGVPMIRESAAPAVRQVPGTSSDTPIVEFERVTVSFDEVDVLRDVSFAIQPRRLTILLGASGSGKSVILKLILGLYRPDAGVIRVNGERIDTMAESDLMRIRGDIGMLFQESALFDSLSVENNVGYRLSEEMQMPAEDVHRRVTEVLGFVGLGEYIGRMPSELSGGQRRRVAIARAMASKPQLLLFDDPTSGLDPITAKTVMAEVIKLRDLENVTPIVVTHQLPDAFYVAGHHAIHADGQVSVTPAAPGEEPQADVILLAHGGVHFAGTAAQFRASRDPQVLAFLTGWVPPLV